jgi:serine protease SohB
MSEFFFEYGLFFAKIFTVVVAIVVIIGVAAATGRKAHQEGLEVEDLNKKYKGLGKALRKAVLNKDERKQLAKEEKKHDKAEAKHPSDRPRSFIINFKGDLKASALPSLREEVSAILDVATGMDEVIVCLENHGGVVHEHGLAASQLVRIRDKGIPLIVCVDKVAASGGYLMACVATKIYAAPFAILGSIGVLAQLPNCENTDEDRAKLKEELEDVHTLFKAAISEYRPDLDLDRVATGEHWYGTTALQMGLADEIKTSDELLIERAVDRDLYALTYRIKQPLQKRLMANIDSTLEKVDAAGWRRRFESRLPR